MSESYTKTEIDALSDVRDAKVDTKFERLVGEIRLYFALIKSELSWMRWVGTSIFILLLGLLFSPVIKQWLHLP